MAEKKKAVCSLLQILIADFAHELTHERVLVTQIDNVHFGRFIV